MDKMNIKDLFNSPTFKVIHLVCFLILTILYVIGVDTESEIIYSVWRIFLIIGVLQRVLERKEQSQNHS